MKNKVEEEYELLEKPILTDEQPIQPIHVEEVQSIHAEEMQPIHAEGEASSSLPEGEPSVKDQARGAAWAGGISGFIVGGPIMACVLGYGGYHFAEKDSGELGNFCRKTGDFTNKVGSSVQEEWDKSGNESTGIESTGNGISKEKPSSFRHKAGSFTNRVGGSIKKEWDESEPMGGETSEGDKKKNLLTKSGNFITRIGKTVKKRWNEAKSAPLRN